MTDGDMREEGGSVKGMGAYSKENRIIMMFLIRCGPAFFGSSRPKGRFFHDVHFFIDIIV